jgi:hypothetical protein
VDLLLLPDVEKPEPVLLLVPAQSRDQLQARIDGLDDQAIELTDLGPKFDDVRIIGQEAAKSYRPSLIAVTMSFTANVAFLTRNVFGPAFFAFLTACAASLG